MMLSRRAALIGLGAGLLLPPASFAAEGGRRSFTVLRGGDPFGTHLIDVRLGEGGAAEVAIDIELRVKMLGMTAFSYTMENREVWKGGRLVSMNSVVNDDGEADFARAKAVGDEIEIDGSGFQGRVPGDAVSTTYWSRAFLERKIWINTQTGVPIDVVTAAAGPGSVGGIATERFTAKGEKLDIVLHYAGEEWVSVEFDAGGEPAAYVPESLNAELAPVWVASL